jgi:hypothetical protein
MVRRLLFALAAINIGGCSAPPSLPGGYSVSYGDRGKAWLENPDGTMAHGALIKQLFKDDRHILLISFAATSGGEIDGPRPLDGNCYVALLIDSKERQMRQVRLSEAHQLASHMSLVEFSNGGCLQGRPTS